MQHNFIKFKFREKYYYLNFPTKSETNKWYDSLR